MRWTAPGTSKLCNRSSSSGSLARRCGQCFGANEIRNCSRIRSCPSRVPKTSGSQSTYLASWSLHQNDLGTKNPKDLETSEDHSLGKTWQGCCKLSTHIASERMLQAVGTHHLIESLLNRGRPSRCRSGWLLPWPQRSLKMGSRLWRPLQSSWT